MHILPIIPARFESERFPGKLLADYNNSAVIEHPIGACIDAFGECFVLTDSIEIVSFQVMASLIHMRGTYRNGTERIADACDRLNVSDDTLIMHVQGDEVGLRPEDLKRLATCAVLPGNYVSTLYYQTEDERLLKSPDHVKCWTTDEKGFGWKFTRSYYANFNAIHVGVYCYRRDALRRYMSRWPTDDEVRSRLEQLRWDVPIVAYEVAPCKSINVPEDLE